MLPCDLVTLATVMTSLVVAVVVSGAPNHLDPEDYEVLADDEARSADNDSSNVNKKIREVIRCYCNQPICVPQGYMCLGKGCFTELPPNANTLLRIEQSATRNGCLNEGFKNRQCPAGYLCCNHDLCNHVDTPAMKDRLNKTLQVLAPDQRAYLSPMQPSGHGSQGTEGWFRTTTIAVAVGGLVVLLILASLAVRLLQPVPAPIRASGKLVPHRTSVNGPPLLGPPKVPLV
ncbi:PREDICTED: BMP and activin membrane-bound inhibitor homolog [Dinoponera quadriceps]|uniref:BMP and activin membrane-bound inhibitor homolog n=1 Tax=Dinoponera quadriceps TaxID=609295 RepID=A0A6P3WX70_DINQU|nr:PREDICTED: BMP and activin membrane-bound inhibitor homolog [Dinoponera quadriceps]